MSVSVFQSWANQYPTWEALKTFLTSEDVGVSVREFSDSPSYAILRYVKGKTNFEKYPELVWARSVVWNKDTHRPLCVAPRKANSGLPPLTTKLSVETFVDGVMVNVFATRNPTGDISFHTATRSQLNADGFFYSSKSFLVLFMEALQQRRIHSVSDLFPKETLPTEAVPSVFLSFVLQHPEHRVVERVRSPIAYLVQHGGVHTDGRVEFYAKHPAFQAWHLSDIANREFSAEKDIYQYLREQAYQRGWTWQGLVFRDEEGNRWRLRTSTYSLLRSLRGSEASPELRFLRLRSEGKMSDYLKHYHEDRQMFWNFEQKLRKETRAAYDAYIEVHKAHAKKLGDLENPIRTAVYLLHSHYLKDLRPQNQSVVLATAIELINSMPYWQQAQFLKA